jgi:uncharacterized membrane protein
MANMRRLLPGIAALFASLGFSLWALPRLPERVVTHWGVSGQPDGWSPPLAAALLLPVLGLVGAAFLTIVPRIDPRRASFELHASTYWLVCNAVLVFLAALQVAVIGYGLGWPISIDRLMPFALSGLLILIGNVMTRMRPNWFMGIRTPWTLSSERVWRKTHRLGGYCFVAAGIVIAAIALAGPEHVAYGVVGAVGLAALVPAGYSYLEWRREQEEQASPAGGMGPR